MNIFTVLLTQPLTNGLVLFYKYLGQNMGVAILAFSIALIFLLRPLTKPYMESMKKIKEIQPQIDKLKKKYGSDKIKFSRAQAELYKQRNINPAAGCLPYILQIVILIALFRVFTTALAGGSEIASKLNQYLYPALKLPQTQIINTKFLYLDVSKPDTLKVPGVPFPIPGIVLILAAISQFLSVKITAPYVKEEEKLAQKTKEKSDDMALAMTQSMTYTMPVMTIFFGMTFPSGLALYWFVFSVVNVFQQVGTSGWGGLTPFVKRLGLVKSQS